MYYRIKIKLFIIVVFGLLSNTVISQTNDLVNPKGKLYLGVEIGTNTITSYTLNEPNTSLQGGVLLEYYFAKHWSVSGRVKYFRTGLSFMQEGTGGGFFSSPGYFGVYSGEVFAIPINIKWEFKIYKNFHGNIKLGYAYNIETKSDSFYTDNLEADFPKNYGSINSSLGFNYAINNKISIYIDCESFYGGKKGNEPSFIFGGARFLHNRLFNIGVKYALKNKKKA